ncbi:MAG: CaiB/BaiF CoA transferase family protein, partial [Alphaproteobacteria bacterium]
MAGPLAGIRVIDVSTVFMGPLACQIMGDLGADVIKVEAPGGDSVRNVGPSRHPDMAGMFLNVNRSKRAILLDMSKPEGQEAMKRLAKDADILVHNIRPKPAAKLGITYDNLSAVNPKLIFCTAVGYGSDGPYRDRAAYDDLIQGVSGVAELIARHQGGRPDYVPMAMADKVSGLVILSSVLAALFHRERTGEGQAIEVPMFETISAFSIIDHLNGLAFEPPMGTSGYARQLSPYRHPFK